MHSSILIAVHHHGLQANSINKKASCEDDAASEIMKAGAEHRAVGSELPGVALALGSKSAKTLPPLKWNRRRIRQV